MRIFLLSLFFFACTPGVEVCLSTLEAKCQKLLDCDPDAFSLNFGDQADVAQCVSQTEQDTAADQNPETQTCEEQVIERPEKQTLVDCLELLPDASCEDFLGNKIEACR
jgi:hypothetical protein